MICFLFGKLYIFVFGPRPMQWDFLGDLGTLWAFTMRTRYGMEACYTNCATEFSPIFSFLLASNPRSFQLWTLFLNAILTLLCIMIETIAKDCSHFLFLISQLMIYKVWMWLFMKVFDMTEGKIFFAKIWEHKVGNRIRRWWPRFSTWKHTFE